MNSFLRILLLIIVGTLGLWLIIELGVRLYLETPLKTGFYSSISRDRVREMQTSYGVQVVEGLGWAHLGWIAHPEQESYRIVKMNELIGEQIGKSNYGSYVVRGEPGIYQVWVTPVNTEKPWMLAEVTLEMGGETPPLYKPQIAGSWQYLFRPSQHGDYVNDHTVYQDGEGNWRLVGITAHGDGDFDAERYFAVGSSEQFPPPEGMLEESPVADFGELAWAPHVIREEERYHMFWSPHQLHQMDSLDGIAWGNYQLSMPAPKNKFFRDPMVLQVATGQWLLYTTARGTYFSQVDIYQSFNLTEWQYIRSALTSSWGSERNSPFASMESPFVSQYRGRYYLSLTYNNDSYFWPGILMLFKIWPDAKGYNDTLVFHSDNPYDFGVYRGKDRSPTLLTHLETHAPEFVYHPQKDEWYITTAGWPWVATLTSGEVALAPLSWLPEK